VRRQRRGRDEKEERPEGLKKEGEEMEQGKGRRHAETEPFDSQITGGLQEEPTGSAGADRERKRR
jgi:hypothetical protein